MSEKAFPEPGFTAPDFSLPDHSGEQFTLSANRGRPVVVFFYPMDGTMVCTAQNKCVLDAYADFEGYNAVVVAISGGSIESRSRFVARYGFRHTMLVDEGRKVARRWGAVKAGDHPAASDIRDRPRWPSLPQLQRYAAVERAHPLRPRCAEGIEGHTLFVWIGDRVFPRFTPLGYCYPPRRGEDRVR